MFTSLDFPSESLTWKAKRPRSKGLQGKRFVMHDLPPFVFDIAPPEKVDGKLSEAQGALKRAAQERLSSKVFLKGTLVLSGAQQLSHSSSSMVSTVEDADMASSGLLPHWPKRQRRQNSPRGKASPSPLMPPLLWRPFVRIEEFYSFKQELGKGNFGVVRMCVELATGQRFACKTIEKSTLRTVASREDVCREIEIMESLAGGHEGIVSLKRVFEDQKHVHMVMDLCEGGELFNDLLDRKRYDEFEAADVFSQLVSAVGFSHSKGVLHRDLKPENILLSSRTSTVVKKGRERQVYAKIKLADWGLSVLLNGQWGKDSWTGQAGSPFYMAPEVVKGERYDLKADVWSLGVILYILLSGIPPFWGETDEKIFAAIKAGRYDIESGVWERVSESAKGLIRSMLRRNPAKRPTLEQLAGHPWLAVVWDGEEEEEEELGKGPVADSSESEVFQVSSYRQGGTHDDEAMLGEDGIALMESVDEGEEEAVTAVPAGAEVAALEFPGMDISSLHFPSSVMSVVSWSGAYESDEGEDVEVDLDRRLKESELRLLQQLSVAHLMQHRSGAQVSGEVTEVPSPPLKPIFSPLSDRKRGMSCSPSPPESCVVSPTDFSESLWGAGPSSVSTWLPTSGFAQVQCH
eukprot:TRINITY_DN735_c1_g2_i1.p1 TRINITY_DN735_c1_g2~~TRINITY_DN735_c1_g2_i1.p1  ORF type:complete len:632 (+),score=82.58 TRINITY_DN735_c1_g2_i1:271-2166(+)